MNIALEPISNWIWHNNDITRDGRLFACQEAVLSARWNRKNGQRLVSPPSICISWNVQATSVAYWTNILDVRSLTAKASCKCECLTGVANQCKYRVQTWEAWHHCRHWKRMIGNYWPWTMPGEPLLGMIENFRMCPIMQWHAWDIQYFPLVQSILVMRCRQPWSASDFLYKSEA